MKITYLADPRTQRLGPIINNENPLANDGWVSARMPTLDPN
jgi:hypothetical protein